MNDLPSVYCTYFDRNYFSRGITMINSLRQQGDSRKIYILALDDFVFHMTTNLNNESIIPITLTELENEFPELLKAKRFRSSMEYIFTLTPYLTMYVQNLETSAVWTTYLDADLCFFSTTEPIYEELQNSSVAIIRHRFTSDQRWRLKYGTYNVSWVSFRNDDSGRKCVRWWAESCLNWCSDVPSEGRFADQGYLDQFHSIANAVHEIGHPGANLAPWNIRSHKLNFLENGVVQVDGKELIFFHFHGLKLDGSRFYFKHVPYLVKTTKNIREFIYRAYCENIFRIDGATPPQDFSNLDVLVRKPSVLTGSVGIKNRLIRRLSMMRGDFLDI